MTDRYFIRATDNETIQGHLRVHRQFDSVEAFPPTLFRAYVVISMHWGYYPRRLVPP